MVALKRLMDVLCSSYPQYLKVTRFQELKYEKLATVESDMLFSCKGVFSSIVLSKGDTSGIKYSSSNVICT